VGADWTSNITNRPTRLVSLGDVPSFIGSTFIDANAVVSPEIRGNWVLAGNVIVGSPSTGLTTGMLGNEGGSDPLTFYSGATYDNRNTAPFRLYKSGAFVATNGKFQTAGSGARVEIGVSGVGDIRIFDANPGNILFQKLDQRFDILLIGANPGNWVFDLDDSNRSRFISQVVFASSLLMVQTIQFDTGATVSFGANDSAGTGYRVLRVPNA
jgi:hypothetical protein